MAKEEEEEKAETGGENEEAAEAVAATKARSRQCQQDWKLPPPSPAGRDQTEIRQLLVVPQRVNNCILQWALQWATVGLLLLLLPHSSLGHAT